MTSLRMLVVVLAAALSCLQGCASALEAERAVDPDRLTALFRNYQADYIVMSRPSDLEKISQLVLVGRVAEVREGRTWQVPDVPWTKSTSVIVVVEPEKVLGGKSSTSEHRVFVELDNPGRLALSEYQTALSIGIRVIFYLSKAGSTKDTPDRRGLHPEPISDEHRAALGQLPHDPNPGLLARSRPIRMRPGDA